MLTLLFRLKSKPFLVFLSLLMLAACTMKRSEKRHEDHLAQLGRHLFFDTRLSGNGTKSCATCHDPKLAFTDGYRTSSGIFADATLHNAPTLVNARYLKYFSWTDPKVRSFTQQMQGPLFKKHPPELGLAITDTALLRRLEQDTTYVRLLQAAYGKRRSAFTFEQLFEAISAFESRIVSFRSPFDRYVLGDTTAMSAAAMLGKDLFSTGRFACASCHTPPLFTDADLNNEIGFHNIGLYNIDGKGAYPVDDQGLFSHTKLNSDMGRFKTPTLRNIALTAPYMHDGSIATLPEVLQHYAAGGRNVTQGPFAGDGRANPHKDFRVHGFTMNEQEQFALLSFLNALTDTSFLRNNLFANPW